MDKGHRYKKNRYIPKNNSPLDKKNAIIETENKIEISRLVDNDSIGPRDPQYLISINKY